MRLIKPCQGSITSLYSGSRLDPVGQEVVRPHRGTDYSSHSDNTIRAAAEGKVRLAINVPLTSKKGFGRYVVITHPDGWETVYAHLSSIDVSEGQQVTQGQKIGMKGSTGNSTGVHLHFEVSTARWNNQYTHHVDPAVLVDDPDVRQLQEVLNRLGFKVSVDGLYGEGTFKVVSAYQRANKLTVDGVAGAKTILAMNQTLAARPTVKPTPPKGETIVANTDQDKNAKPSPALAPEFAKAKEAGITDGTYPNRVATRAEVAVMNYRVYESILKQIKQ